VASHSSDGRKQGNVRTSTRSKPQTKSVGSIDVEIQGQTLTVRSDHDREFVEELAEFIDGKLGQLKEAAPQAPTDKLLMMASLTVAEELFEKKSEVENLREQIRDRAGEMYSLLEQLDE
jgi:cell division protein ZapA (FtsZ GTPase activity inhibitor)